MEKILSPWCKQVKCELIKRDMSVSELAESIGMSRPYTSAVVNGRIYAKPAVKAISNALNIQDTAESLTTS